MKAHSSLDEVLRARHWLQMPSMWVARIDLAQAQTCLEDHYGWLFYALCGCPKYETTLFLRKSRLLGINQGISKRKRVEAFCFFPGPALNQMNLTVLRALPKCCYDS